MRTSLQRCPWLQAGSHGRLAAITLAAATLLSAGAAPMAVAGEMGAMVKAICLSAFQAEMQEAGKPIPAGMADFACDCVVDRLSSGSSLEGAKASCRQLTARRYPL